MQKDFAPNELENAQKYIAEVEQTTKAKEVEEKAIKQVAEAIQLESKVIDKNKQTQSLDKKGLSKSAY